MQMIPVKPENVGAGHARDWFHLHNAFRSLVLVLISTIPLLAFAAEPPTEPTLRVETGMHTTLIRRLVVDHPRNRLITCSDDKTVRVWQMPEARLVSVLRVPIGPGHEGQLFGLAVSPDGKTIAAGGWTTWDWDGAASVYFFDTSSGELIRRVGGLKDAVGALAWTADQKHLIIGLQGRGGLQVLRVSDGNIVTSDTQYNDKIMDIDVARNGRIVAVALDGMTRLYDKDFKLIGRRAIPGGTKPTSVRLSPDASLFAIGYVDVPAITVGNARDLSFAYQPDLSQTAQQVSFNNVTWSSDGEYLYGGGDYKGSGQSPIYRWRNKGRGAVERISVADNRITNLETMPDGRVAFATEDPSIGVLGADGLRQIYRGRDIIDFRGVAERLQVSGDASIVSYPQIRGNSVLNTYSLLGAGDQNIGAPAKEKLHPPLLAASEFRIENWEDSVNITINGEKPKLDDYELSRSYAIAHDHKTVLIGTEWGLHLLDPNAKELWNVKLAAVAWGVNIAPSGKFALAALSDGTIRWYRMSDGKEILAYFPHGNGQDWISWESDGYYASSVLGDNFIGWHLNRGKDAAPDFFRAVQFDRILFRPDVVAATFRATANEQTKTRALELTAMGADFEIRKLREISPPRLRLQLEGIEFVGGKPKLTMRLVGEKGGLDIKDYTVFVNNIPITPTKERKLSGRDAGRFSRRVQVDLSSYANNIRAEAFNGVSMGIAETFVSVPKSARVREATGELYVLAIGVNKFPRLPERMHLAYAAADADEFSKTIASSGQTLFKKIHTRTVTDFTESKPDRQAILSALNFVQQARAEDTVMIFLASHGISDESGNYYFVPRDVAPDDLSAIAQGKKPQSLLPWTVFFDALRNAAGRRILVVDTCQAKNIEGKFDAHSLIKHSASSLFSILVAAKGDEESQEYAPGKHGLFTFALISALSSKSDANNDGIVSLREVFDAALPVVDLLRAKSIGPQTPQLIAPAPLGEIPLMKKTQTFFSKKATEG